MTLTMKNEDGNRDLWIILVTDSKDFYFVNRMFNKLGTETFDLTLAVEVEIEGKLRKLKPGDKLSMEVDII